MSYSSSSPTHTSGPEPSSKVTIIWSLLPRRTGNMWSASLPKETHFFQVEFQLWWHSNAFWWNSNAYQCSIWHGFNVQMQSFHNQVMVQYSFYGVNDKTNKLWQSIVTLQLFFSAMEATDFGEHGLQVVVDRKQILTPLILAKYKNIPKEALLAR